MKKFIAIGRFQWNQYHQEIEIEANTVAEARHEAKANEFHVLTVLSEKMIEKLQKMNREERWEQVKKLTTNYRKWRMLEDRINYLVGQ